MLPDFLPLHSVKIIIKLVESGDRQFVERKAWKIDRHTFECAIVMDGKLSIVRPVRAGENPTALLRSA